MAQHTKVNLVTPNDLLHVRYTNPESSAQTCKILVQDGLFSSRKIEELLRGLLVKETASIVIITDSNVRRLYGPKIFDIFARIGKTNSVVIPQGERSKTLDQCSKILSDLSRLRLDKSGVLVLLGGGVVGDLGGFVASIYKRGTRYIQVPTTLLAQIDSSIGGKTGIDTPWGKNQIGTIYQPLGVLIDPKFLNTLPRREILNGIGEMVKYGVIASKKIFSSLETALDFRSASDDLKNLIETSCKIKADIVTRDEFDQNIRSILNYGHTVAHAIEATTSYRLSHGSCVLIGMLCEGWIAKELGIFEREDFERQEELIMRILPKKMLSLELPEDRIVNFALGDKKNVGGKLMMSLPERIGRMHKTSEGSYKIQVPERLLSASITALRASANNLLFAK